MSDQPITETHIAIIGGGIIGLTLALALRQRNVEVLVVEADHIASGASGAAAGMLTPIFEMHHWPAKGRDRLKNFGQQSLDLWQGLAEKLSAETGFETGFERCGALGLACGVDLYGDFLENIIAKKWAKAFTTNLGLGQKQTHRQGALVAGEGQISPVQTCQALAVLLKKMGGALIQGMPVERIDFSENNSSPSTLYFLNRKIRAQKIILANGAGASRLWQEEFACPVFPVKGQALMLGLTAEQAKKMPVKLLRGPDCYICVKSDRELLIGATEHRGVDEKNIEEDDNRLLLERAEKLLPFVSRLPRLRAWAGIRPGIADHAPILDQSQRFAALYYAIGHYRNGVLLAPLSAQIMAEKIISNKAVPAPFRLSRFT